MIYLLSRVAGLILFFYVLLFAKEKVKDLLSLHLCRIDSSVFGESIRKVLHKYQLGKGTKYNKFHVASTTKACHDEYNNLSFHPSTHFLSFCQFSVEKKTFFFSVLLLSEWMLLTPQTCQSFLSGGGGRFTPAVGEGEWLSRIGDWHNRGGEETAGWNTLKPEQMSAEEKRIRSVNSPSRRHKQRRLSREADAFLNVLWWWGKKGHDFSKQHDTWMER